MKNINSHSLTFSEESLKRIVADTLELAKARGASQAEAGLSVSEGMSVSARMRSVETIEYQQDNGLGISVYFGQHKGTASTTSLSHDAIQKTVEAAWHIAKHTSEDPCTGLADENLLAERFDDLELFHGWDIDNDKAITLALECEAAALDFDTAISNSEGASVDLGKSISAYGNSSGFVQAEKKTRYSISCSVVAQDNQGMQGDYWYSINRSPEKLQGVTEIGRHAARRAVDRLGAHKLNTCQAPVMFVPELARGLIGHLNSAISGNAQYRKASFLLDALDTRIFPEFFQLTEHPYEKAALGSANYDAEGVATHENELIKNGVLQSYLLDSYSARKLGRQSNGHASGVHNLKLADSGKDFSGCLRAMDKGLLVTELIGHGVSVVTGDYSRGAAGFWVENGQLQYPVEEITIASNLKDMFAGIIAIGSDVDERGRIHCGSVVIDRMTIAGAG